MAGFIKQIRKFTKLVNRTTDRELREVGLFALSKVVTKTPIDEGTARGNWFTAVNSVDRSVDENRKSGTAITHGTLIINGFKSGGVLNISNSLPYINRLEHGYSNQAPIGMVKVTELEILRFLKSKSKKV